MGIEKVEQLEVWKRAHAAVLETYRITAGFPPQERYRLVDQMCRAAVSIPANIAESFGRRTPRDKAKFYNYSQSSLEELRYYYTLARDLRYLKDVTEITELLNSTARMLNRLILRVVGPFE
jgi:four helix bundle protein